jgi:PST family polysaccharide transporter
MSASALGVYTLAFRIPELLIKQLSGILGKVIFPVYATMRDDRKSLTRGFLLTMQYVNLITVPMGLGLAMVSSPIIILFFGERWQEGAPVMAAISIYSLLRAMVFNTGDVYKAIGSPDILVKIHIWQVIISIPALWWSVTTPGTIEAVAWMQVVLIFLAGIVKLIIASRILDIPPIDIGKSLGPSLLAGSLMVLVLWGVRPIIADWELFLQLVIQVFTGALIYVASLLVFSRKVISEALQIVKTIRKRKTV